MTYRPRFQPQGPAGNCIIDGKQLGWQSCTAYAQAMGIDFATLGAKRPSGCAVRRGTGDTTGGLTLPQVAAVAGRDYDVDMTLRVGANVASAAEVGRALWEGRGVLVQIGTRPLLTTEFRATQGAINHAVWVNEGRGWSGAIPDEVLVFDSAADGRPRDYHVDQGPSWWPWSLLVSAAGALEPNGEGSADLGRGKMYAGWTVPVVAPPDTSTGDEMYSLPETDGPYPATVDANTPIYDGPDDPSPRPNLLNEPTRPFTVVAASKGSTSTTGRRAIYGRYTGAPTLLGWVERGRING